MRISVLGAVIAALLWTSSAFAASGTIEVDTVAAVEQTVRLRWGCGTVHIGSTASADFGGGTLTVERLLEDGTWGVVKSFTAVPDIASETLNFGGVQTDVGVSLASSTGPDLYWEIQSGNCGAR